MVVTSFAVRLCAVHSFQAHNHDPNAAVQMITQVTAQCCLVCTICLQLLCQPAADYEPKRVFLHTCRRRAASTAATLVFQV